MTLSCNTFARLLFTNAIQSGFRDMIQKARDICAILDIRNTYATQQRGRSMELRQLRYFVEAARLSNFTRAAERLRVAQPALSQQIGNLEQELGIRLFERSGRGVTLTRAGEAFFIGAERTLAEVRRAEDEARMFVDFPKGKVRIGTLDSLVQARLPRILVEFGQRYPGVEVSIREETTIPLLGALKRGELDLVLAARLDGVSAEQVDSLNPPANLAVKTLYRDELVLAVTEGHRLADRNRISLGELKEETFICFKEGSWVRAVLLATCAEKGFKPRILYECARPRTLVAAGLGVAVLPRTMTEPPGPPVVPLSLDPPISRPIAAFFVEGRYLSPAAETFLRYVLEHLVSDDPA